MTARTPEHDVARRIHILVEIDPPDLILAPNAPELAEVHMHVGADLRSQTNEEAGKWIKAIIDRVVKKELAT